MASLVRIFLGLAALSIAPGVFASDAIVKLPPYIVTASRPNIRWHYAAIPGFEILSCCSTGDTEKFAEGIHLQQEWLDEIVPPYLQLRNTVPTTFLLLSDTVAKAMAADVSALGIGGISRMNQRPSGAGSLSERLEVMPQLKLTDDDSVGVDVIYGYQPGLILEFDSDYVFYVLAKRSPPLPLWFSAGAIGLYRDRIAADEAGHNAYAFSQGGSRMNFLPALWISAQITEYLFTEHHSFWGATEPEDIAQCLLPMQAIVSGPLPPAATDEQKAAWLLRFGLDTTGKTSSAREEAEANLIRAHGTEKDSPWLREIWVSQGMLFIRWALDDTTFTRRHALWQFVERSGTEPVTESLFRDCFGLGYAEMGKILRDYLPVAVSRDLTLKAEAELDFPSIEPRDPTEAEEARILGDWQRKEIDYVKSSDPQYAEKYGAQANQTLMTAYDDGVRDPGLLAAIGLCGCATGDDDRARGFLEAAVQAGVSRPRAYVELARIRLAAAMAKPAGGGPRLDRAQVASVVDLVRASRAFRPAQISGYLLAADAWEHADFVPTPADLRLLYEGLVYFPDDPRLMLATAQLDAAAGMKVEAIRVLDGGLQKVSDPAMRNLFLILRKRYAGA